MRALLPAVLVLLAACDEPPGLTLEVVPLDPSIEYVEVYLSDHCPACPDAMTPPMMRAHSADMFETDYPMVFSASKSEPEKWKNGHAFFRVTTEGTSDGFVTFMVLVGYDANKTPIAINRFGGVPVPATGSEYWKVLLDEPVAPLTDMASDQERIAIWGMNRTGPRCLLVVYGDGRAFGVVPKDDPDCDGQVQHDCAPYIPNAVRAAPDIDHASCVVQVPAVSGSNASAICLVGGPPCTDGTESTGCEPLAIDYCAPSKACAACPYPGDWETCAKLKLTNPDTSGGTIPFENCSFAMNLDGTECTDESKRTAEIDLGGLLSTGGGTKCTGIKIHTLSAPLGPFVDKLDFGGGTLELGDFQEPCKITTKWNGNYMRGLGPQTLVLDVALDNGKHLAFPMLFHGSDSCATESSCKLSPLDSTEPMLLCTKPTMDTTTCTSTATTCQGGVACGARCCGIGESCRDGACHCGDGPACADSACVSTSPNPSSTGCGDVCCGSGPGTPACM